MNMDTYFASECPLATIISPRSQITITWQGLDPLWNSSFWEIGKQPLSPSKWYNKFQLAECEHDQP